MIKTESQLESYLSEPTDEVIAALAALEGDVLILGVGGKMGPTLAKQAKRAIDAAGITKRVIGVSRFSVSSVQEGLQAAGIETIAADLLSENSLRNLPNIENVILMAGRKFGSIGNESLTWAMNGYMPGRVADKFRNSRLVIFSTGNVYPLTPVSHGGATENSPIAPIGEYAQSCLSRERICTYFSLQFGTLMAILRLNYAIDLRYGILLDIAEKVYAEEPISLGNGKCECNLARRCECGCITGFCALSKSTVDSQRDGSRDCFCSDTLRHVLEHSLINRRVLRAKRQKLPC